LGEAGDLFEQGFLFGVHAEVVEFEEEALAAEDTEADRFAVFGGDDGDAEVIVFAGGFHGDTAVVGQAFFGDIEAGHDFEAGDDGGVEGAESWGDGYVLEDTVDTILEADGVVVGFEVDIGGLEAEGFEEDLVDEVSDGGIDGAIVVEGFDIEDDVIVYLGEAFFITEALDGFGAEAEVFLDGGVDGAGGGEGDLDTFTEEEPEVAEVGLARGVAKGEREQFAIERGGDHAVVEDEFDGDDLEEVWVEREEVGFDEVEITELGEGAAGGFFGGEVEVDDGAVLGLVMAGLVAADLGELSGVDEALLEEDVPDVVGWGGVGILVHGWGGLLDGDFERGFGAEGELVGLAFCICDDEGGLEDIGYEDISDEVTAE
jgi:hypothetical protein